ISARDESAGRIGAVTDDEILAAHRDVARLEGVFCEPSSAGALARVAKAARAGEVAPEATVVCVLTGNGLKDPSTAEAGVTVEMVGADASAADGPRGVGCGGDKRGP